MSAVRGVELPFSGSAGFDSLSEAVAAEPEPSRIDAAELSEKLDAYVASFGEHWGEAYRFSGFILVAQGGKPVYAKGFGMADRDQKSTPTADTTFRIGSVTKQFTAAAKMLETKTRAGFEAMNRALKERAEAHGDA